MTSEAHRRVITLLAAAGFFLSILRLMPLLSIPRRDPLSPRAALAQDMQLYESAIVTGSPVSYSAFRSVKRICRDDAGDAVIEQACGAFDDALRHDSNRGAIDAAVHLLAPG